MISGKSLYRGVWHCGSPVREVIFSPLAFLWTGNGWLVADGMRVMMTFIFCPPPVVLLQRFDLPEHCHARCGLDAGGQTNCFLEYPSIRPSKRGCPAFIPSASKEALYNHCLTVRRTLSTLLLTTKVSYWAEMRRTIFVGNVIVVE